MIKKIDSFVKEKISDKTIAVIGISILCVYYFIGLLSYITVPITPVFSLFKSSSPLAVFLRVFTCGLIVLFSVLILIKYKPKIEWSWLVLFCFLLLMVLFSIIISPSTYEYSYVEQLYKVIHTVILDPGVGRTIIMFCSSIADFIFAFCIMFILPFAFKDKKKLLWLLIPIVIICCFECFYSFVKEKDTYLYMFNHPDDPYGGYGHEVGATFGNKEDWGAFIMVAISSSFACIFFLGNSTKEKIFKVILFILIFVFSIFTVLSLCKTAILSMCLLLGTILIGFSINLCFKSKKHLIFTVIILFLLICLITAFFATSGFGNSFLHKISEYIKKLIIDRSEHALAGRSSLWINYMQNVRGYNLFFGMGKNYVNAYTKFLVKEGQASIHNGFAYFFASYGLVGFMIFISLLFVVVKNIFLNWKINKMQMFLFLGLLFSSLVFVLAESEVLIVSTSTPIFIYNVLVVMLPAALIKNNNHGKRASYEN